MLSLGIETSCDETGVAIVEDGRRVISNVVASSLSLHSKYGGVIPEIASRAQLEYIYAVAGQALKQAGLKTGHSFLGSGKGIGLVCVTAEPGLRGSLLVGLSFARGLSFCWGRPLVYVNHIKAHIYAALFSAAGRPLERRRIRFPFVGLVVSGGHTNLFLVRDFGRFVLLGRSVDDAAGEAFDKVARVLGLGYPGGPQIERLARSGRSGRVRFSCGNLDGAYDFSFSGIKTAVLYKVSKCQSVKVSGSSSSPENRAPKTAGHPASGWVGEPSTETNADIAHGFQEAVFDDIVAKSVSACINKKVAALLVGGGVAINKRFRDKLTHSCRSHKLRVYFSPAEYCPDNAAMVAGLGYWLRRH
ncbi:MAG: tRNA (adenosine(37)-N6)-threonylcarbamoyltransferase complex transferase subunit TsaD [Candidatus Omnitrophota bacterium]